MDFISSVLMKVIIYFVILILVRILIKKMRSTSEQKNTRNEIAISQPFFAKVFWILGIVFSVILIFATSVPSNLQGGKFVVVLSSLCLFNVILYLAAIYFSIWKISINTDKICIYSITGKKSYDFSDVKEYALDINGNVEIIFENGKKVVVTGMECISEITSLLKRKNVSFRKVTSQDVYIVEENTFYRVFSVICVLAAVGLLLLCISVNNLLGIIMFGALLIAAIIDFGKKVCDKVIVSKEYITVYQFLKRKKDYPLSELKYIKRKNVDNLENTWIYSEEKLLFRYRKSYKNVQLLEDIVRKLKQKK